MHLVHVSLMFNLNYNNFNLKDTKKNLNIFY